MPRSTLLLLLVALCGSALAGCPSSSATSPCTCREETQGRILDCASITSGQQLATLMQNDMGDPHFDFFQAIKESGTVMLDSLPSTTFADKTLTHIWIGASTLATVANDAFDGSVGEKLLEILLGDAPSLTSFPYSSLEALPVLFKLQITSSGLEAVTSFGAAPELSEIKLTNAAISSVAAASFAELPNLALVDLAGNPLRSLTLGAFESSTIQPWTLYLDNCGLSSLPANAFGGTLPVRVDLAGNQLTTVSQEDFDVLVSNMATVAEGGGIAGGVNMAGNPVVCDCALAWFATDAAKAAQVMSVVCANDDLAGTPLADLPADFFDSC